MIVTIHQPEHLPWLGFFHKMSHADCMVILDNVQYRKNYFQNRNKILTRNGPAYLTVPVSVHEESHSIKDVRISSSFRRDKYTKTLCYAYKDHPFFTPLYHDLESLIRNAQEDRLASLNLEIIRLLMNGLHLKTKLYLASELDASGSKSGLLHQICKRLKADAYLSGPSGRDYLDEQLFRDDGMAVLYHDFHHPSYPQRGGKAFVSHMSAVDLLFNCGNSSSKYLLREEERP